MPRPGDQMQLRVSLRRRFHSLAVFRKNEAVLRPVDKQDRNMVLPQAFNRAHLPEGIPVSDPGADRNQINQEPRQMHSLHGALQHRNDVAEAAVRNHKVNRRFFLQHRNGCGRAEGFPMNSQNRHVSEALPAVLNHGQQILAFPDGIGADRRLIQPVPAQIINDHVESQLQIHICVFQRAETIVRVSVGNEDIPVRISGVFQKLRVKNIPVPALYGIIRLLQGVIPGEIIVLLLPGPGFFQGLPSARHGNLRQKKAQPHQQGKDQHRDDYSRHNPFSPVL